MAIDYSQLLLFDIPLLLIGFTLVVNNKNCAKMIVKQEKERKGLPITEDDYKGGYFIMARSFLIFVGSMLFIGGILFVLLDLFKS